MLVCNSTNWGGEGVRKENDDREINWIERARLDRLTRAYTPAECRGRGFLTQEVQMQRLLGRREVGSREEEEAVEAGIRWARKNRERNGVGTGEASLKERLRRQPRCLNFVLGRKQGFKNINTKTSLVISSAWIAGESLIFHRWGYMLLGGGDLEVMTSPIRELVVKSLDTRVRLHITAWLAWKGFLFVFWSDFQPDGLGLKLKQKSTQLFTGIFLLLFCLGGSGDSIGKDQGPRGSLPLPRKMWELRMREAQMMTRLFFWGIKNSASTTAQVPFTLHFKSALCFY